MLEYLYERNVDLTDYIARVKKKGSRLRLMGFGHRVYKNYDPRAHIMKETADKLLGNLKGADPLLEIARRLEEVALSDPYFIERQLYPNVDFYSGVILRAMGIPVNMFTVMFAMGRMPGWIAHWKEVRDGTLYRPRQIYEGAGLRGARGPVGGRRSCCEWVASICERRSWGPRPPWQAAHHLCRNGRNGRRLDRYPRPFGVTIEGWGTAG